MMSVQREGTVAEICVVTLVVSETLNLRHTHVPIVTYVAHVSGQIHYVF